MEDWCVSQSRYRDIDLTIPCPLSPSNARLHREQLSILQANWFDLVGFSYLFICYFKY